MTDCIKINTSVYKKIVHNMYTMNPLRIFNGTCYYKTESSSLTLETLGGATSFVMS